MSVVCTVGNAKLFEFSRFVPDKLLFLRFLDTSIVSFTAFMCQIPSRCYVPLLADCWKFYKKASDNHSYPMPSVQNLPFCISYAIPTATASLSSSV